MSARSRRWKRRAKIFCFGVLPLLVGVFLMGRGMYNRPVPRSPFEEGPTRLKWIPLESQQPVIEMIFGGVIVIAGLAGCVLTVKGRRI